MIIDRRTFILISAPFFATAAALAILPSRLPGASSPQLGCTKDIRNVAFKVHGWDQRDDSAADSSKIALAGPGTDDPYSDEVFISINQSWRTAWR